MRGVFGFSHDRGRYQMGMNLDSLYWGMLHYQLFNATRRSKPNVLNEHPRRISGVSLFTEKSEFFNRIRIVGPHCARRDEARICDTSCNPLDMGDL